MCYIHTVEYYSALKKKEILTQPTTCMNLKVNMLSEISQTKKTKYSNKDVKKKKDKILYGSNYMRYFEWSHF